MAQSKTCPRCERATVQPFPDVRSSLAWYRCEACDFVWADRSGARPAARTPPDDPPEREGSPGAGPPAGPH